MRVRCRVRALVVRVLMRSRCWAKLTYSVDGGGRGGRRVKQEGWRRAISNGSPLRCTTRVERSPRQSVTRIRTLSPAQPQSDLGSLRDLSPSPSLAAGCHQLLSVLGCSARAAYRRSSRELELIPRCAAAHSQPHKLAAGHGSPDECNRNQRRGCSNFSTEPGFKEI
jgi:hypothetical protein